VFTVTTSCLLWFRSEAFRSITNAMLHVETARIALSPLRSSQLSLVAFSTQLLSGPRFRAQHTPCIPVQPFARIEIVSI